MGAHVSVGSNVVDTIVFEGWGLTVGAALGKRSRSCWPLELNMLEDEASAIVVDWSPSEARTKVPDGELLGMWKRLNVGIIEGPVEGTTEGMGVAFIEGLVVGGIEGLIVGATEGMGVASIGGLIEGAIGGLTVDTTERMAVGITEGSNAGAPDGFEESAPEGRDVGDIEVCRLATVGP